MQITEGTHDAGLTKVYTESRDPQGWYIAGADGTSYGWANDHDPADVQRFMNRGLAGFRKKPPAEVEVSEAERTEAFAVRPDDTTSVVKVFSRIDPLPEKVWGLNRGVGRDYLWIYPDEVEQIRKSAQSAEPFELPATLVRRIVRYHLVDNVRGTPDMWGPNAVRRQHLTAVRSGDAGESISVRFDGVFSMHTRTRGYEGKLEGELTIDAAKVTRFRAYAVGDAWGAGSQTPFPPPGRFKLHIAMIEGTDEISRTVPPEAVSTKLGDAAYRAPQ